MTLLEFTMIVYFTRNNNLLSCYGCGHSSSSTFANPPLAFRTTKLPAQQRHSPTFTSMPNLLGVRNDDFGVDERNIEILFPSISPRRTTTDALLSSPLSHKLLLPPTFEYKEEMTRRSVLSFATTSLFCTFYSPRANADFAPGGTLLDREVSITYGNSEASPSRARDNSNVLFAQDNYYKFGAAAKWILPPGSTDYPLTVPFVPSQRRYDALKKYGPKVKQAIDAIKQIGSSSITVDMIPVRTDPSYQLRSLGLIADSFLASDNTGTTNELMLARWYINEVYLRIGDYRDAVVAGNAKDAEECYQCLIKAMNSYLSLLNRSITNKVGDQFGYIISSS